MVDFVHLRAHPASMILPATPTLAATMQIPMAMCMLTSAPAEVVHHDVPLVAVHAHWHGGFVEPDNAVLDAVCGGAVDFVCLVAADDGVVAVEGFVVGVFA